VGLLRRVLRIAAGPDALVLDPFAGSGTTAQAVLEQNASDGGHRKFVLIEADSHARTLIPWRLAQVPGRPPDYDFYTLVPGREEFALGREPAARRRGGEPLLRRRSQPPAIRAAGPEDRRLDLGKRIEGRT